MLVEKEFESPLVDRTEIGNAECRQVGLYHFTMNGRIQSVQDLWAGYRFKIGNDFTTDQAHFT